jgi:hypothetical protein
VLPRRRGDRGRHRAPAASDPECARRRGAPGRHPAQAGRRQQVHGRIGARGRRRPWDDRRSGLVRPRCLPGGCRLRRGRRAGGVAARPGDARAGGGQAPLG